MSGGEKFVKSGAADAANFIFNWINARRENKVSKRQGEHIKFLTNSSTDVFANLIHEFFPRIFLSLSS